MRFLETDEKFVQETLAKEPLDNESQGIALWRTF